MTCSADTADIRTWLKIDGGLTFVYLGGGTCDECIYYGDH